MAKSNYRQENYASRDFVESAGSILFDFRPTGITLRDMLNPKDPNVIGEILHGTTKEPLIGLVYNGQRKETLLPKGRRNIDEPRETAALRETHEETGLRCQLFPVTLQSRATSMDPKKDNTNSSGYTVNEVRQFHNTMDPFWMTIRHGQDRQHRPYVKVIWWYIAVVEDAQGTTSVELDPGCELRAVPWSEADEACTYEEDREVVREAIRIVRDTLGRKRVDVWKQQEE